MRFLEARGLKVDGNFPDPQTKTAANQIHKLDEPDTSAIV